MTIEDTRLKDILPEQTRRMAEFIAEGRPYVWRLRLSMADFLSLEQAVMESVASHGGDHKHLLTSEMALKVVIYLGEWYKRRCGSDDETRALNFSSVELEKLYKLAGINIATFVYNASKNPDRPSRRWNESMQVLGGLPLQAEIKRSEKDGLMPRLCRIFHGEDIDLDTVADRGRAVAFTQSITRQHSLYDYLDCILDKDKQLPFADSDLTDKSTFVPQFLKLIKEANREAMQNKFDFDWIVTYAASRSLMVRYLRVRLKPEVIGGGRKQYLGYDRLRTEAWGMECPEKVGRIAFYLLFKDDRRVVSRSRMPVFRYDNTGNEETGFLSVGQMDETVYTEVPVEKFNRVEMVMAYDGLEHVVQTLTVNDYMQLYAITGSGNRFSTRRNSQTATVLVFSNRYHLVEEYSNLPVVAARYGDAHNQSEEYCWCPINDKVIIADEQGNELPPFFNRNGLYQVVTKKYMDTIRYRDNVFVVYKYLDADYDEEELQEDLLPVMFGRKGLEVVHYASTKDNEGNAIDNYQLKWFDGHTYIDWEEQEPPQGAVRLKVFVKDYEFKLQVYYVPFTSDGKPVWRDFDRQRICTSLNNVGEIQDGVDVATETPGPDTRPLTIGPDNAHVILDVYRPILLHELYQNGQLVETAAPGKNMEIPLINCGQFALRVFSESGVHRYSVNCRNSYFYAFTTLNRAENQAMSNYLASNAVSEIDPELPLDFLQIYISKHLPSVRGLYVWNYQGDPQKLETDEKPEDAEIVFQSLKDEPSPRDYAMPWYKSFDSDDWDDEDDEWDDDDWDDEEAEIDPVECFLTAAQHRTYYFLFTPLVKVVEERRQAEDLVIPLLKSGGYTLSQEVVNELYTFALHFHFDWMLLPRTCWQKAINEAAANEEEREKLAEGVFDFFRRTPKITDERERVCLDEFLEKYWTFDDWPKVDGIADKALKLILDKPDALAGVVSLRDLLKLYDVCRFKFTEMSKVVISHKQDI